MTDDARQALRLAADHARSLNDDNAVGVEHLLLALIDTCKGAVVDALFALNVSRRDAWTHTQLLAGTQLDGRSGHQGWTSGARAVLRHSLQQSKRLGHNYISAEHLMLGVATLLDDPWAEPEMAGEVLNRLQVPPGLLRQELLARIESE